MMNHKQKIADGFCGGRWLANAFCCLRAVSGRLNTKDKLMKMNTAVDPHFCFCQSAETFPSIFFNANSVKNSQNDVELVQIKTSRSYLHRLPN